jgi:hypothetical protein
MKHLRATTGIYGIALACAPLLLAGCFDTQLTEKPSRGGNAAASFSPGTSTLGAQASIALADAAKTINERVPASFSNSGNGEDLCAWILGVRTCVGTHFSWNAARDAMTLSAPNSNTLRVSVPISFSGQGGFRGDGCRVLSCNAKNFQGSLVANIDLSPSIDKDWCPRLDANVSYAWVSNPRVEIVGRVWVDVTGSVNGKIQESLGDIRQAAQRALDCGKVKPEFQKVYGSRTYPVKLPDGQSMHVNFRPSGLGQSGLFIDQNSLRVSALLQGTLEVSGTPLSPEQLPLPTLAKIPAVPPQVNVAVAVKAPYEALTKAATAALAGKTFEGAAAQGKAKVTVKGVEIYPSGERVVVGLKVAADLPTRWLDVSGDVYLFAKPVVDSATKVRLADIGFARKLDNEIWSLGTALFEKQIIDALASVAVYDFANDIANAKKSLQEALARPATAPGVRATLDDVSIGVGRVAVTDKDLAAEGLFAAKVSLAVTP